MGLFGRKQQQPVTSKYKPSRASQSSEDMAVSQPRPESFESRPTLLRLFTIFIYLAAVVFLILVEIGNISTQTVINDIYFFRIDISNIVPETVPNAQLINSLAQSIGLHDFYQVGLWNYCEGYNGQGVTDCGDTEALYWFNPVAILLSELLAGASIVLPGELLDVLDIIRTASHWMFACFLVGICLTFLSMIFAPMAFSKTPRWSHRKRRFFLRSTPVTILTFLAFIFTAGGAVIATVMFVIFRNVLANQASELNIVGELGVKMMAFEWVAVALNLLGFLMQIGTCCGICCCTGRKKALKQRSYAGSAVTEK